MAGRYSLTFWRLVGPLSASGLLRWPELCDQRAQSFRFSLVLRHRLKDLLQLSTLRLVDPGAFGHSGPCTVQFRRQPGLGSIGLQELSAW